MRALSAQWFSGFQGTPDEKQKLEGAIRNSTVVLDILTKFCEKELARLASSKEDDYQFASWPYLQADRIGQQRVYRNLLQLTKIDRNI